jgi:hypothetical protein
MRSLPRREPEVFEVIAYCTVEFTLIQPPVNAGQEDRRRQQQGTHGDLHRFFSPLFVDLGKYRVVDRTQCP